MVNVRCLASRMIGDDRYHAGEEYLLTEDRAARYHAYFAVLGTVTPEPGTAAEKLAPPPPNKRRTAPQNKGRE